MKLHKVYLLILLIVPSLLLVPVSADSDFANALAESDLPSGFTLKSTIVSTEYNLSQIWKTPSDSVGMTSLTVIGYNDTDTLNQAWTGIKLLGSDSISFSGADESVNITFFTLSTYYAKVDKYLISSNNVASNFDDVKILIEAQIKKLSGGATPGFTSIMLLIAFGVLALGIIIKKRKQLN